MEVFLHNFSEHLLENPDIYTSKYSVVKMSIIEYTDAILQHFAKPGLNEDEI